MKERAAQIGREHLGRGNRHCRGSEARVLVYLRKSRRLLHLPQGEDRGCGAEAGGWLWLAQVFPGLSVSVDSDHGPGQEQGVAAAIVQVRDKRGLRVSSGQWTVRVQL